jgi:hypothetical protein
LPAGANLKNTGNIFSIPQEINEGPDQDGPPLPPPQKKTHTHTHSIVSIFLLYLSKHAFVIFPAREIKNLNWIEFREISTYIKINLRKVPQNTTLT